MNQSEQSNNNKKWEDIAKKACAEEKNAAASKQESAVTDEAGETTVADNHKLQYDSYEVLEKKLTEAEERASKYWNEVLHARADMANLQKRAERDIANAHKYAIEKMASELLVVVDNLERCLENKVSANEALNNVYVGVELTLKMFLELLQKFDIKQVNPLGENFNPEYHTAMMVRDEAQAKPNSVLQVVQKGYILKDRLLRPALVVVAKS